MWVVLKGTLFVTEGIRMTPFLMPSLKSSATASHPWLIFLSQTKSVKVNT